MAMNSSAGWPLRGRASGADPGFSFQNHGLTPMQAVLHAPVPAHLICATYQAHCLMRAKPKAIRGTKSRSAISTWMPAAAGRFGNTPRILESLAKPAGTAPRVAGKTNIAEATRANRADPEFMYGHLKRAAVHKLTTQQPCGGSVKTVNSFHVMVLLVMPQSSTKMPYSLVSIGLIVYWIVQIEINLYLHP